MENEAKNLYEPCMTSFDYDAKKLMDVVLSCRCHLSDNQEVFVQDMLDGLTCLWLCSSLLLLLWLLL